MWKIKSHTKRAIQTRSCLDPLLIPRMIWIKDGDKIQKQGGESSKPEIDWDLFKSKYENMKRVGKGKHRTMDVEGMNMIYDALYDKGLINAR